jgi:hypothetical protein
MKSGNFQIEDGSGPLDRAGHEPTRRREEAEAGLAPHRATGARWFSLPRFGTLLLILIVVSFPDVVSGRNTFFYRDFSLFGYPLACYHRACFWRGEWPLWNPFNDCGLPFLAQWNTLTLYPGSLLYLLLPLPWSLSFFSLVHLWLAGVSMYLLARAWTEHRAAAAFAGVVYAFNGLMLHALMWPNNIAALAWLPLVVLFMERARSRGGICLVKAALIGAMQMLAGAPEIIFLTWVVVGVFWLAGFVRSGGTLRSMVRMVGATLLVGGLSAAQLLPFFVLLLRSQRDSSFGGNSWSMPSSGWMNFLVPLVHCSKSVIGVYSQDGQQWTSSYYLGLGALGLGLIGLLLEWRVKAWLLGGLGLTGIVLSMGDSGGLLPLLKSCVPGIGVARYPIKCIVLTVFALPLLAGFGILSLERLRFLTGSKWAPLVPSGVVWGGLVVAVSGILWSASRQPVLGEHFPTTFASGLSRAAFLTLTFAALLAAFEMKRARPANLALLLAVVLAGLDGLTHAPRQNPTLPVRALKAEAVDLSFLPKLGQGRARVTPRVEAFLAHAATPDRLAYQYGHQRALFDNLNLVAGVPKLGGFFSLYPRNTARVESLLYRTQPSAPEGLLDFLGVVETSSDSGWFDWKPRPGGLPLVQTGARPVFADPDGTTAALLDPHFDPREVVYLPPEARAFLTTTNPSSSRITGTQITPQGINFHVSSAGPSLLVVAQSHYDCWKASVDDQQVRVWPANLAFQALEVPAGSHLVRLVYQDRAFQMGLIISIASLLLCVAAGSHVFFRPAFLLQSEAGRLIPGQFRTPAKRRMPWPPDRSPSTSGKS